MNRVTGHTPALKPVRDSRAPIITRFHDLVGARLTRSLELLAAGATRHAAAIRGELEEVVGAAAFLGLSEILEPARRAEAAARRIPDEPAAVGACLRAIRALVRALDALGPRAEEQQG